MWLVSAGPCLVFRLSDVRAKQESFDYKATMQIVLISFATISYRKAVDLGVKTGFNAD